ncbi:MAG: 5-oxoprolinase subunit PxpB, partial [Acidobacteriota bacterium]|nr:5-oxoprolinase subunit PxpB [Acidobacteriota bacterium]
MSSEPVRVRPVGERAALVELASPGDVHRLWRALRARPVDGVEEVVAGASSLLLRLDPAGPLVPVDLSMVAQALPELGEIDTTRPRSVTIPVFYDGPDLEAVAEMCGLSRREVVARHSATEYTVAFLGFSPGFAYLAGGPGALSVPRLATPRPSVPAGSVGLADEMAAVYPQSTPGGWRIIGRTGTVMFDSARNPPALLSPGDRVRFEPATGDVATRAGRLSHPLTPPAPGQPAILVVERGPHLTVQDLGRPGWAHVGVPAAGAADRGAARAANQLVGNPDGAAVMEALTGPVRLRMRADRLIAVTGADAPVTVDGLPARRHTALALRSGSELVIGRCHSGLRIYLAVSGGFDLPVVLGSRSTDTLSGLGPSALCDGDLVAIGPDQPTRIGQLGSDRVGAVPPGSGPAIRGEGGRDIPAPRATGGPRRERPDVLEIQARWGPRDDRLGPRGQLALAATEWSVSPLSDRVGVRLEGPPLSLVHPGGVPSEGMVAGAVQVPPAGHPIILMRNHPPTGGYPVVAVV